MPAGLVEPSPYAAGPGVSDSIIELGDDGSAALHVVSRTNASLGAKGAPASEGLLLARWWQLALKRSMDILGSLVLLLILLPLALLTIAAIRLTSRGPAIFVQERVGREGEPFRMLKFRSMKVGAHEERGDVLHLNQAKGPVFKIDRDPRITRIGRLLRKLSIDELPQLINVLVGDMSLVGPRPPLPDEYQTYGPRERRRLDVAPGITCIWQISGRSDVDFDTWVEMDLEYIRTWTIRQDLRILIRTVPAVVSGRGAY
ncbi:MAG TPA: sugar transferase [Actinomycetota bacterium]|nr:sugar transferase [Actinomycetota bacterium]